MGFYESVIRPALFALEPETAHNLGLWAVSQGLVRVARRETSTSKIVFGVHFPNPIGLAAGFDKNGVALEQWKELGFGFVEIGTVTQHPQPGNPKPRLFRLPHDRALINRMGFNNDGADALARRLQEANAGIPVGINIGKSKVTALEDAHLDYAYSMRLLAPFADYVVVNVSSPNTPGLRGLQERGPLLKILTSLREIDAKKPLLVKVAPDLDDEGIESVVSVVETLGLTGFVATNTTLSREGLTHDPGEAGGLSGAPLQSKSNRVLEQIRRLCDPTRVVVGVGGVMTGADVVAKLDLGADLVQIYTGWVYGGPQMVSELVQHLESILQAAT